ncbi:MAG: 4Fe-4S dicluster domain-containing protein [Nitrospirota bacterium]
MPATITMIGGISLTGIRLLIDTSKCIACKACQVVCQQWHSLPSEDTNFTGTYQNPPDMSGANLTVAKFFEIAALSKVKWLFFKDQCRHCEVPNCQQHCPFGAIIKQTDGIVRIDPDICNPAACSGSVNKPCQLACHYNIPKYMYVKDGSSVTTDMRKCDLCYNRFGNLSLPAASQKPSCEATCPPGAIFSGDADTILIQANDRVTYLQANGFPNANVYPNQSGVGTLTHVIWVLTEDPAVYGLS